MNQDYQFFQNDELFTEPPKKKNASYFRARGRELLKGKYWLAVLAFFLASLLGGVTAGGANVNLSVGEEISNEASQHVLNILELLAASDFAGVISYHPIVAFTATVVLIGLVTTLAFSLFVSSPIILGYRRFNLDLADGKKPEISTLFSYFSRGYGKSIGANLLMTLINLALSLPVLAVTVFLLIPSTASALATTLYTSTPSLSDAQLSSFLIAMLIWMAVSVLCSVLSILVYYRLYFAYMVLAEYPEMRVIDAFRTSATLMKGNKWRLFCLELSFIGWQLLAAVVTCGIGTLFLQPYVYASTTAFYDDIAQRANARAAEFPSLDPNDYNPDGTAW